MYINTIRANLAQLVEQLIRNEQVIGSSPIIGSIFLPFSKPNLFIINNLQLFRFCFSKNQKNA